MVEQQWEQCVFVFSALNISFEKDKLPALSGVVKQMLRLRPGDEYLAGVWRNTILEDIRWYTYVDTSRRPSAWRSPSWSWASLDGSVFFPARGRSA